MSKDHDFYHDHSNGEDDQVEFSVIAISEDLLDVELVFYEDRVGEYAGTGEEHHSMFRQVETINLDVGEGFRDFGLHVFNTPTNYSWTQIFFFQQPTKL